VTIAPVDVALSTRVRALELEELAAWDGLVARFPGRRVGHTRAWVESLAAAGHGTPLFLVFERGDEVVGCLPGLLVRVAGFTLFGSPLPGWQTASMGPVFDAELLPTAELIDTLVRYLERVHHVAHIELMLSGLDDAVLRAAGFRGATVGTFRAPLHPGAEETTFAGLKDSARRNIRRAERLGVEIRMGVDADFVDDHYAQLREVYLRGGNAIPFSRQRLAAGVEEMHRAGKLIAVSAYLPGDSVRIATATFLVEADELQLWMWAHSPAHRWYRVTELLTWRAMQRAMAIGCTQFDLLGRGDFKMKFGAALDETKQRWVRSRSPVLAAARPIAHGIFQAQQMVRGRIGRALLSATAARTGHPPSRRPAIACVLGDIDLVRALGLAGIRSDVVAPPGAPSRYSRHTRHALDWIDPFTFPDQLVDLLVRYGQAQDRPPTLFYQDDASLLLISRHRTRLARAFRFVVPEATLVDDLADKARFQALAERIGLPVPAARAMYPASESPPTDLPFEGPFIVKPLMRRPESWSPIAGTSKALLLRSLAELQLWWPRLAHARIPVLAQALVPGPERGIESYHVYVDERGERVAEFTGRKIRTYPAEFGDSSAVEIVDLPDLVELGRDLTRRLGLRGVAKFDFKRRADGSFALLEVNPRFTLWHHPAALAGLNIPALVHADVAGLGRARPAMRARSGVRWCKVWTDHAAARAEGVPFLAWLLWAMRCEAKRAIAWNDPLPLLEAGAHALLSRHTGTRVPAMGLRP
jgi:predicted ATP-grasp superfamily ATP-dependent carboligase